MTSPQSFLKSKVVQGLTLLLIPCAVFAGAHTLRQRACAHWMDRADAAVNARRPHLARNAMQKAVTWDSSNLRAQFLLGNTLLMTGSPHEAIGPLRKAVEGLNEPDVRLDLGIAYKLVGDAKQSAFWFSQAISDLRALLVKQPGDPRVLRKLGFAYLEAQKNREALDCFIKVALKQPQDADVLNAIEHIRLKGLRPLQGARDE